MIVKKGHVFIIEDPTKGKILTTKVKRTHRLNGFVIVGGTGQANGSLLILKKESRPNCNIYCHPDSIEL